MNLKNVRVFEKSLRICKMFLYLRNRKKEKEKTKKAVKPVHTLDRTLGNHMIKIVSERASVVVLFLRLE